MTDLRLRLFVGSARQDLVFFARCLAPLAGLVANSAPAAAAWFGLLNAKTLLGTGLPCHPWVEAIDGSGGVLPSRSVGEMLGDVDVDGHDSAASQRWSSHDREAALLLAMASAADKDEWSAMLVGAGLVRSLVNSLQACLDFRTAVRGLDLAKVLTAAGKPSSPTRRGQGSTCGGGGRDSFRRATQPLQGEVASGGAAKAKGTKEEGGRGQVARQSDGCLGCELETAQVLVVVALGALLSAHPLAARDRFQLSGGMLRVHRAIFQQPKDSRGKERHECVSYRGEGCDSAAPTLAFPFLQEHCALVSLQVLRLCLRADDAAKQLPSNVVEGVVRLVGALSPSMQMAWDKGHLTEGGPAGGLPDCGEMLQEGGMEGPGNSCDLRDGLAHSFLPLGLLDEVPVLEPRVSVSFSVDEEQEAGASASASASSGVTLASESTGGPAAGAKPQLNASSYRLCG